MCARPTPPNCTRGGFGSVLEPLKGVGRHRSTALSPWKNRRTARDMDGKNKCHMIDIEPGAPGKRGRGRDGESWREEVIGPADQNPGSSWANGKIPGHDLFMDHPLGKASCLSVPRRHYWVSDFHITSFTIAPLWSRRRPTCSMSACLICKAYPPPTYREGAAEGQNHTPGAPRPSLSTSVF